MLQRDAGGLSRDPGCSRSAQSGVDFCAAAGVLGLLGEGARHLQELEKAYEAWRGKLD